MKKTKNDFLCVMVTGISGAGKSQAIKCLEDFGFFCIDNLPAPLLPGLADLILSSGPTLRKVAIGMDARSGQFLKNFAARLHFFKSKGIATWTLFLDADNATLVRRFSETRHRHPFGKGILESIQLERKSLSAFRAAADRTINTSHLTLSELKEKIAMSLPTVVQKNIQIEVQSFGFKHGAPAEADILMDVRFLPNPNYVPSLHDKTGLTSRVQNYVLQESVGKQFLNKFLNLIELCVPQYIKEGKSHLTIAIGCTGGRHRSVTIAERLAKFLKNKKYTVLLQHRDI